MQEFNYLYYCMADEIGEQEHTPHTHLYFYCENAVSFDTVKKRFQTAHIETAYGTSINNRDYILKQGKHADKSITSIPDTFEEFGELPDDRKTKNETVSLDVLNMIKNGFSNCEIINNHPSYINKIKDLDNTRNMLIEEKYKNEFRKIEVIYIFGKTATGKTRYVMDKYGYENVYKITNYKNPFDNYEFQDVLLLDEFHSSLTISDLLQYLDGYPCRLPARYSDKWACFTKVYIISNIDLDKQYPNIQLNDIETFNALIRRINSVFEFKHISGQDEPEITKILPYSYFLEG